MIQTMILQTCCLVLLLCFKHINSQIDLDQRESVDRILSEFHDIDDVLKMKRPSTGFYANPNPNRSIIVDSRFFQDPPGGVEALIQLSIALSHAASKSTEVYINDDNYHDRWKKTFDENSLIHQTKSVQELQPGDIYIFNEGIGCPEGVPEGVLKFVYLLARYMGCQPNDPFHPRYISHNHYLTKFDISLPRERIIHPYLSLPIIERAFHRAGLQRDGVIIYERSQLKKVKENIVLFDNDIPWDVVDIIKGAARDAGGEAVELNGMSYDELMSNYDRGKVVIDWCMRGSERCPLEASLFGAIAISNNCSTGLDFSDFPVPRQFMLDKFTAMNESENAVGNKVFQPKQLQELMKEQFKAVFENYWDFVSDYEPMRRSVLDHNPASMIKEAIRFLATTHITQDYKSSNEEDQLMETNCKSCRRHNKRTLTSNFTIFHDNYDNGILHWG